MNLPKFILKKDFEIETNLGGIKSKQVIHKKGKEFSANENNLYIIEWFGGKIEWDFDQMKKANQNDELLFEELKPKYELVVKEVDEDDDNLIGSWRIQIDVKVTRKKLREIENLIREKIMPIV